jgi:hypothetical protein
MFSSALSSALGLPYSGHGPGVSETVKANQLWSEVLDNAAFEAEQMGKSFTVEYPATSPAGR